MSAQFVLQFSALAVCPKLHVEVLGLYERPGLLKRTHLGFVFSQTSANGWDQLCLAVKMQCLHKLHKLEIEVEHGTCVWLLNSLALEAVQMRFHENPKAQACSHYPVAYQQHSYSLEDLFILRVDIPEVYYTFSIELRMPLSL